MVVNSRTLVCKLDAIVHEENEEIFLFGENIAGIRWKLRKNEVKNAIRIIMIRFAVRKKKSRKKRAQR